MAGGRLNMSNPCTCCKDESALCAANSSAKDGKPASCEVAVEGTKLSHGIRCAGDDLHMTDTFFDLRDKRDQSGIWRFSSSVAGVLVIRCGSYKAICRARGSANWTGGSFIANTPGVMPDFSLEEALHVRGLKCVAGVDEAGRGPLAGPVAAAAVILPQGFADPGLDDSKKLSPKKREALYHILTEDPQLRWSVALASALEIDTLNILRATHLAMQRAVAGLDVAPDHCLIDGLPVRGFPWPHAGIVKGDGRSLSIAAASILAKVTRDRLLREIDAEYPLYGFARHQGYGTKEHLEALRIHGPCRHHRRSFQPVAQLALPFDRA